MCFVGCTGKAPLRGTIGLSCNLNEESQPDQPEGVEFLLLGKCSQPNVEVVRDRL